MLEKLYNAIATVLWAGNPSNIETKTTVVQNKIYLLSQHHKKITPSEKSFTITKVHKKNTTRHLVTGNTSTVPDNSITAKTYRHQFNLYLHCTTYPDYLSYGIGSWSFSFSSCCCSDILLTATVTTCCFIVTIWYHILNQCNVAGYY